MIGGDLCFRSPGFDAPSAVDIFPGPLIRGKALASFYCERPCVEWNEIWFGSLS